jgi:hypothetical protein
MGRVREVAEITAGTLVAKRSARQKEAPMRTLVALPLWIFAASASAATVDLEIAPNVRDKRAGTVHLTMEVADSHCSAVKLHAKDAKDTSWYQVQVCPEKNGLGVELFLPGADLRGSATAPAGKRLVLWRIERMDGSILEVAMTRR